MKKLFLILPLLLIISGRVFGVEPSEVAELLETMVKGGKPPMKVKRWVVDIDMKKEERLLHVNINDEEIIKVTHIKNITMTTDAKTGNIIRIEWTTDTDLVEQPKELSDDTSQEIIDNLKQLNDLWFKRWI